MSLTAITAITLTSFRCYGHASLHVPPQPVVLTGENGAGKTNLLEAVSFLSPGRGLRSAGLQDVQRYDPAQADAALPPTQGWSVSAKLQTTQPDMQIAGKIEHISEDNTHITHRLGTGRDIMATTTGREKRLVRINGENASQQALAEMLSMLWLTPQMDRLFQDSAGHRRRFLDRMVFCFDPAHAGRVSSYEKKMRERSKLLKDGRADPAWLSVLEAAMAEKALAITAARADLISRLNHALASRQDQAFPRPVLTLKDTIAVWLQDHSALQAEERFRASLHMNRKQDSETGGSILGPHRSDLSGFHTGKNMPADLCSTGEQKALLIAIILGQARLMLAEEGRLPILLLDEVVAHLDERRRHALFDEIFAIGAQAWITGTDAGLFAALRGQASFQRIANAQILA